MRHAICALIVVIAPAFVGAAERPNVLVVITDDQGFGDLGAHGNPVIKTPNLDAFAKQSAWLKNFSTMPLVAPRVRTVGGGQCAGRVSGSRLCQILLGTRCRGNMVVSYRRPLTRSNKAPLDRVNRDQIANRT